MPRDGNGVYSLPPGNPVVSGTVIDPVWANTTLNDIAAALTDSVTPEQLVGELGTAAVENMGVAGHTVPFLDGINTWSAKQTFGAADFTGSVSFALDVTVEGQTDFNGAVFFNDQAYFASGTTYEIPLLTGQLASYQEVEATSILEALNSFVNHENVFGELKFWLTTDDPKLDPVAEAAIMQLKEQSGNRYLDITLPQTPVDTGWMQMFVDASTGYWVWDAQGRLSRPTGAAAIDDPRHIVAKSDLDAAINKVVTPGIKLQGMGRVNADGTVVAGSVGFSCTKTGVGTYNVTTTASAADASKIMVLTTPQPAVADRNYTAYPVNTGVNSFTVKTGGGNSYSAGDVAFNLAIYFLA
jgi:hypothetical protein